MKAGMLRSGVALLATAVPAVAHAQGKMLCCGAKFGMTFMGAAPEIKLLVVILWGVAVGAIVVWARDLHRRRSGLASNVTRSLGFLRGWRLAAPLLASAGAFYLFMNFFVAVYAYPPVQSYQEYAPGLAEMSMVLWAGFTAGGLAALTYAHLQGRTASST